MRVLAASLTDVICHLGKFVLQSGQKFPVCPLTGFLVVRLDKGDVCECCLPAGKS